MPTSWFLYSLVLQIITLTTHSLTNCIECLMIDVGEPEYVGGPTCCDYDSPVTSIIVNNENNNNYDMRQYSANSISYLIYNNTKFLTNASEIGLGPGPSTSNLDHCGAWLNSAINNLINDSLNTVHAFYHEEWNCNYSDNGYTNKSIAYAISTNGGLNFTKANYPHNQIILAPNTTTQHQTGEGDHQVAVINNTILYLYFKEWDGYNGVTVGLARSINNGLPGTWYKYLNNEFISPGLGGNSSEIVDITGTCVRYRNTYNDFIAMGNRFSNKYYGFGPRLSFSNDGIHNWIKMNSSLLYVDQYSWNRQSPVGELIAYPSLISRDIDRNNNGISDSDFVNNNSYWLYYTYLEPNTTFSFRYLVRRQVNITQYNNIISIKDVAQIFVKLSYYYNSKLYDSWFTTAMVSITDGYMNMNNVYGKLMTIDIGNGLTTALYDCYISEWNDHMIGLQNECNVILRTLGWIYNKQITNQYFKTVPLYRCFNNTVDNHFVSLNNNCDNNGKNEFILGYIIK